MSQSHLSVERAAQAVVPRQAAAPAKEVVTTSGQPASPVAPRRALVPFGPATWGSRTLRRVLATPRHGVRRATRSAEVYAPMALAAFADRVGTARATGTRCPDQAGTR
ncbi:hypothetical protein [Nocardioides jishulii]|uniref:Uncharacterized protein n=1 Tax=Nocardioides jishulii TaxID=2575440 RepID=A0A4U2YSP5_9ACTN|nr:hypothetical protein [Nocardioides jishulii]QCX28610.1 hypothetical protein FCL41_14510 [Nocardioides jishulii]TKI64497.1 hypothetical protein FC770_05065 [Nocardioides jishulii]